VSQNHGGFAKSKVNSECGASYTSRLRLPTLAYVRQMFLTKNRLHPTVGKSANFDQ